MGWIGGIPSVSAVTTGLNVAEPGVRTQYSPYSRLHYMAEHLHSVSHVYPSLAGGVAVATGAGAWTEGNFVEIVPASTITDTFDIHWMSIESISANGIYELSLYYGAADTEAARVRFTKNAVQDGTMNIPILCPLIQANDRIRAKCASDSGSDTVTISLMYHTY